MNELNYAYLAGLVDGEGSIGIIKAKRKVGYTLIPYFVVTNSSRDLIDKVLFFLKGLKPILVSHQGWKRIVYQVRIQGLKLQNLFKHLLPYLVLKKFHCRMVLQFIQRRINKGNHFRYEKKDWLFFFLLKDLNKKNGRNTS